MCFNAPVSFFAASGLSGISVALLHQLRKKRLVLVALIPLLFAVQQFTEGLQWLAIGNGGPNAAIAYVFLMFAFVLWPTYIPLSVIIAEPKRTRRYVLCWLFLMGVAMSVHLSLALFSQPLTVEAINHHIVYGIDLGSQQYGTYIYLLITVGSLLLSSYKTIRIFGILGGISFFIAMLFYTLAFFSVWCLFAAVLSGWLWFGFRRELKE